MQLTLGVLVGLYGQQGSTYNLSARGRLGRSAAPNFFFLGPPPYPRNEWSYDVEIWYTGRHLQVLWLHVKKSPLGAPGKVSSPHFLFWDLLYISETNGARKLKFRVLVGHSECSTLAAVSRGFVFHTSRLVRLTTLQTCMQRSQILLVQNRVFAYPTCIRRLRQGVLIGVLPCLLVWKRQNGVATRR